MDAIKEPYLQAPMSDSMYVLLEADSLEKVQVDYGLTESYGMQAFTESTESTDASQGYYMHNIKLTGLGGLGLLPNTQYHYQVSHGGEGGTTSADKTFYTAAQPGDAFCFGFMADSRTGMAVHAQMVDLMDMFDPRMLIHGGDTNDVSTWDSWTDEFFLEGQVTEQYALIAEVPFSLATGNHEGWNALTRAFTQGPTPEGESNGYYSFDYGDAHFLILNTEIGYSEGGDQWNFAAADLAATDKPWKIVAFHVSAYCAGGHGEDAGMVAMTSDIFEPNGVDMVLTGHSHFYQHNLVNDIHHMVIGSVAAPLTTPSSAEYTVYTEQTYCMGVFDMTATTLDMTTYRDNGSVIETLHLSKGPDITPPTLDAVSATSQTEVEVVFSEPVELTSAQTVANYTITDPDSQVVPISLATRQADNRTVVLTTSELTLNDTYTLTVNNVEDVADNPIAPDTQAAFQYAPETDLAFQQGVGGYVGTKDTMIQGASSTQNFATVIEVNADSDTGGQPSHALFRFDDIIGSGLDQIAPNSPILSATLRIHSIDDGHGGGLHPMLMAWDDTVVTWAGSFGGDGIQADDSEAASIADDNAASNSPNTDIDFDVTTTLQAWADGAPNDGWAILPNGTNGFRMATAEHSTVDYRPELIVTYLSGPDVTPPTATIAMPEDNGPNDLDPADGAVTVNTTQSSFQVQLDDFGDGIDDATVTPTTVGLTKDGGAVDYSFSYDAGLDAITLTPTGGDFGDGGYVITLSDTAKIADLASNEMPLATVTILVDTSIMPPETVTVVQKGSNWRYLVTSSEPSDQGSDTWRDPAFDDASWDEGPAQLGYGGNGEVTTIGYGGDASNKYTTTYFRHSFEVTQASNYTDLDLGLLRDDGGVVYLNGQEIARSNMPGGEISWSTFSSTIVGGADENTFFPYTIDPGLLVEGANLLAVIHGVFGQADIQTAARCYTDLFN